MSFIDCFEKLIIEQYLCGYLLVHRLKVGEGNGQREVYLSIEGEGVTNILKSCQGDIDWMVEAA